MSFLGLLILLCSLSLIVVFSVLGINIFLIRSLSRKEINEGIVSGGSFLCGFEKQIGFFKKIIFSSANKLLFFLSEISKSKWFEKHLKRFNDYVNGRELLESNGCNGYWGKIKGKIKVKKK